MLPKKNWESRVTSIEESHDLSKLSTDILIGKLLTYELTLRWREEEQEDKEKKKSLAFKASQDSSDESELEDPSDESELEDSSEDDEEIVSFTKYFMEYLKKKNLSKHKESKRGGFKKAKEVMCFKCKRSGHIQDECPKLKHKQKEAKERRRAFKATWDDSSESEMKEEQLEATNLCFMTLEDNFEVPSTSYSSCDNFCDDLCIMNLMMMRAS